MQAGLLSLYVLQQQLDQLPSHRALGEAGLEVVACNGARDLHARLHGLPTAICALAITPQDRDGALLVAMLRASTAAGIIALAPPQGDAEHRIQSILMGADLCVARPSCARELAALVLALQRRLGQQLPAVASPMAMPRPGESPEPVRRGDVRWHLVNNDWELISPQGVRVPLTHNERRLITVLVGDAGAVFSRPELADALSDALQEVKVSSINMLVSRLRGKARHLGVELPLGVLPGRGYALTAPVVRPASVPAALQAEPA